MNEQKEKDEPNRLATGICLARAVVSRLNASPTKSIKREVRDGWEDFKLSGWE